VQWTNLVTLYLRAYESRSRQPILGDKAAAEADYEKIETTAVVYLQVGVGNDGPPLRRAESL
jgi:hypothetical protein